MKNLLIVCISVFCFCFSGCTKVEPTQTELPDKVFDVAMQGVDPAWFVRAMEGINYGIHQLDRYGNMALDSTELFDRSLDQMDQSQIELALLSHGTFKESLYQRDPDRFLLSYEPDFSLEDHMEAAKVFEENILNGTYSALGELGLIYEGIPLNTKSLYPYYEVAQKHDIPVLIHTGFSGPNPQQVLSPAFRIQTANPLLLEDVIIDFPDLKIVMMHMGWPFYDEALYMLGTYPHVYLETSVAVWLLGDQLFNRMLNEMVATAGSEKILYGSLQMAWPSNISRSVNLIRNADYLSDEDKHAILWGNAVELLGIEE